MADQSGTGADATGGSDEAPAPLNDKELALVKRLFSDPFAIPLEFKAWLVAYLETNPPLLTAASIFGFRSTVQQQILAASAGFPVGAIMQYFADVDPPDQTDWLLMDNRLLNITDFPLLYARIGHTGSYPTPGVDPGGGQFHLPEGRGAVLVGKGTPAEVNAIGKNDGAAVAARTIKHHHDTVLPHQSFVGGASPALRDDTGVGGTDSWSSSGGGVVDNPGFTVVNHIIYAPG